jgi:hypothetical protein
LPEGAEQDPAARYLQLSVRRQGFFLSVQTGWDNVARAADRRRAGDLMRERRRATISELRQAIDCLPRATKIAMLNGIQNNPIIVGAYSDGGDGICPMLAAHRAGGRTSLIAFARAWDRFAFRGRRPSRARRATERELLVLRTHLETSLLAEQAEQVAPEAPGSVSSEFAAAIEEHQALLSRRERSRRHEQRRATRRSRREHAPARPGDPDRSRELRDRDGWAWMRVVRRLDDYERALERLESQRERLAERELVGS